MSAVIKYLEKYGKNLSSKEFQKLVEKYNNDNRKPRNKEGNQLTFFPIMVGSRIVFGSTFQDYKNEIEKQLQSDFVDLDNVKKEYQTKVIDKYKNALNTREIYQTFKQGNEPKLCITKTSIKDKYLFYTNVQDVKEVLKLEKYLKDLNQSNIKDTTKEDEKPRLKIYSQHYVLSYLFECDIKGVIPINPNNKTRIESYARENLKGIIKENTFYKTYLRLFHKIDRNDANSISKYCSEHWKDILIELSNDSKTLINHLKTKGL